MAKYVPSGRRRGAPAIRTSFLGSQYIAFVEYHGYRYAWLKNKFNWSLHANVLSNIFKGEPALPSNVEIVERDLYNWAKESNYKWAENLNPAPAQEPITANEEPTKIEISGWAEPE